MKFIFIIIMGFLFLGCDRECFQKQTDYHFIYNGQELKADYQTFTHYLTGGMSCSFYKDGVKYSTCNYRKTVTKYIASGMQCDKFRNKEQQ